MLQAGSVSDAGDWVEAHSLARSIETEMLVDELIDLDEETEDATLQRRRTLAALARGIVSHLVAHLELHFAAGDLRDTGEAAGRLPRTASTTGGGAVSVAAGDIRSENDGGMRIPLAAVQLSGKVR